MCRPISLPPIPIHCAESSSLLRVCKCVCLCVCLCKCKCIFLCINVRVTWCCVKQSINGQLQVCLYVFVYVRIFLAFQCVVCAFVFGVCVCVRVLVCLHTGDTSSQQTFGDHIHVHDSFPLLIQHSTATVSFFG